MKKKKCYIKWCNGFWVTTADSVFCCPLVVYKYSIDGKYVHTVSECWRFCEENEKNNEFEEKNKSGKIMNRKKSHKNGGAGVWWDSGIVKKKVIYVNGNYMGEEQQSNQ